MRLVVGFVLVGIALLGCGKKPTESTATPKPDNPIAEEVKPVEPATLAGTYIGKLTGEETPENSPLPQSIREVVGDANLTLTADGQRFTMTHKGLNLEGSYKVDKDQLVLQVEQVDGLDQVELAAVDLSANKKAKKEPSTPEMFKLFQEILFLTDWRFEVTKDGFKQLGSSEVQPRYEFKRKQD